LNGLRILAVAAIGLCASAGSASALPWTLTKNPQPGDGLVFKFGGFTTENATVVAGEMPPTFSSNGAETTWGIGYVANLFDSTIHKTLYANPALTGLSGQAVDFIIYGIADASFTPGTPNVLKNVGCTPAGGSPFGPGCDGQIHIDFYIHNTVGGTDPVFDETVTAADRTSFTQVTGISDGTPLMKWVLVPGGINADATTTLLQEPEEDTLPTTGTGKFLADCVSGPECPLFAKGAESIPGATPGFLGDIFGQFTLQTPSAGNPAPAGFLGVINDPVDAIAPEPGVLALLGIGILGLFGLRHRAQSTN
jgi:hypothetical protein